MGIMRLGWAGAGDIPTLVPLLRALTAHDIPQAPIPSDVELQAHAAALLDPTTPHRVALAWDGQQNAIGLAAVAVFTSVSDPRPDHRYQMELKELFVLAEYRAAGVGSALLAWIEAEARARGCCRIDWHVKRDNARGIAFYENAGATIVPERLSMRKHLI